MWYIKKGLQFLLAFLMITAGVLHFTNADFFIRIMPAYLPWHRELVYISGIFEILLGLCLVIPRFQDLATWGLIALYIAVFPANLNMYLNQDSDSEPSIFLLLRLPLQGLLILWAYWYTTGKKVEGKQTEKSEK